MVAASVTRRPSMKVELTPARSSMRDDLRAAAVDHHRMHAQELEQNGVGGELLGQALLAHGVAAVFDHHRLAVVDLDEGQRLGQGLGGGPARLVRGVGGKVGHGESKRVGCGARPIAARRAIVMQKPPRRSPRAVPADRRPFRTMWPEPGGRRRRVWRRLVRVTSTMAAASVRLELVGLGQDDLIGDRRAIQSVQSLGVRRLEPVAGIDQQVDPLADWAVRADRRGRDPGTFAPWCARPWRNRSRADRPAAAGRPAGKN